MPVDRHVLNRWKLHAVNLVMPTEHRQGRKGRRRDDEASVSVEDQHRGQGIADVDHQDEHGRRPVDGVDHPSDVWAPDPTPRSGGA